MNCKSVNVALYIGADPFSYNDLDIVKQSIELFGFINIILDRTNRDVAYEQYSLNCDHRSEIINHDLKALKIYNYRIIPIDITVEHTLKENNFDAIVLNQDFQRKTNFKFANIISVINPEIKIVYLSGKNYVEPNFIKTLLDSDTTLSKYKSFCSEYAFNKFKIKLMKKVGITGKIGTDYSKVIPLFENSGFTVINVDEMLKTLNYKDSAFNTLKKDFASKNIKINIKDRFSMVEQCLKNDEADRIFQQFLYTKVIQKVFGKITKSFNNKFVIVFSMMCEMGMDLQFDKTICIDEDNSNITKYLLNEGCSTKYIEHLNEVQMPIEEKNEICDFYIKETESDDIVTLMNKIINIKLRKFF